MLACAVVCGIPVAADRLAGDARAPEWSAWVFGLIYLPLTGLLWPIVEAYLSGGRTGQRLSRAAGRFNIFWSSALVVAYWAMSPLLESNALMVLLGLGVVHLLSIPAAWAMGPAPGRHIEQHKTGVPPSYAELLRVFRVLLPMSYVVLATLAPYLPAALGRLDVPVGWQPVVASVWLTARVVVFAVFERWHGWHGGRWVPLAATLTLLAGFAAVVLAPLLSPVSVPLGLTIVVAGLAVFGSAQAVIYLAALYYALEVGDDGVEAGSWHEALIGVGYTLGPGLGLATALLIDPKSGVFNPTLLGVVAVVAGLTAAYALRPPHSTP